MPRVIDLGHIPGPVIIPNGVEVDLVWNITGSKSVKNVLHGSVGGGFTASAAIAQAIYAAIIASAQWTAYKPFVNSACSLAGVNVRSLIAPGNGALFPSTGAATPGTGAALALPAGVAGIITLRTASAGRGFRGRIYLPGLDSSVLNTTTGQFLATYQTAAQNLITEVQTAMTASGITHALANPARAQYTGKTGTVHAARPAAMVPITSFSMRLLTPGSQRRRSLVA